MKSLWFINLRCPNRPNYRNSLRWFNDQIEKGHRPIRSNLKLRFHKPTDIHKVHTTKESMNLRIRLNNEERPITQIIKGSSPHCSSFWELIEIIKINETTFYEVWSTEKLFSDFILWIEEIVFHQNLSNVVWLPKSVFRQHWTSFSSSKSR